MQRQGCLEQIPLFNAVKISNGLNDCGPASVSSACSLYVRNQYHNGSSILSMKILSTENVKLGSVISKCKASEYEGDTSDNDEDYELCPVECVREFKTGKEFFNILERAKESDSLVVVDFYRTSCGSCKYIEQGFAKLCRGSGDVEAPVVFLKHNVIDEYDEQSEVAERLRIKTVPLFHFYKNGALLEAFPTRDKDRIMAAIHKYSSP